MPNRKRHRTSPHGRGPMNCWCRCITRHRRGDAKARHSHGNDNRFHRGGTGILVCCHGHLPHPQRSGTCGQVARDKPDHDCGQEAGVGRNEMVVGLEYGISSGPISLSPPRGQGTRGCQRIARLGGRARGGTQAQHPSRQSFGTTRRIRLNRTGSHLGSTLKPGRAVLTLGISRRSRSVACIHVDASPSEVHTQSWWHSNRGEST